MGIFFSGTMKEVNPSTTSCGDYFAASATALARRDATACASGLRAHASGTRGSGSGKIMIVSLDRLLIAGFAARTVVSHLFGNPMRGCALFCSVWVEQII